MKKILLVMVLATASVAMVSCDLFKKAESICKDCTECVEAAPAVEAVEAPAVEAPAVEAPAEVAPEATPAQ